MIINYKLSFMEDKNSWAYFQTKESIFKKKNFGNTYWKMNHSCHHVIF